MALLALRMVDRVYYGVLVWVRSAAIRPIPPYAELPASALDEVEAWLAGDEHDDARAEHRLEDAFDRFERTQPALTERIGRALSRTTDELGLALGTFLCVVVWLAFDEAFGERLQELSELSIEGVEQSLELDEELRGVDPAESLDSDDVVAMEQPHAVAFIQEHVDAAIDAHPEQADIDAVHAIYRLVLVELLALSYSVGPPEGFDGADGSLQA